jgi:hypothetical protein
MAQKLQQHLTPLTPNLPNRTAIRNMGDAQIVAKLARQTSPLHVKRIVPMPVHASPVIHSLLKFCTDSTGIAHSGLQLSFLQHFDTPNCGHTLPAQQA